MAESNWIKLNRGIWENFVWDFEKPKFALAWIDMLLMANYKDKKILFDGKVEIIKRGSFITSMVKLAERWKMDRGTVKRFLDVLQDDGMITYTCNNRRTAINIVNYSLYQSLIDDDTTAEPTTDTTANTTAEPTTDTTQHKKVKKAKESKNEKKNIYGDFQNVRLTDKEYEKLAKDYGEALRDECIKFLDEYIAEKDYKSKSHNLAIRRWVVDAVRNKRKNTGRKEIVPKWAKDKPGFNDFMKNDYDMDELERELLGETKTTGSDPELKARADALRERIGGA